MLDVVCDFFRLVVAEHEANDEQRFRQVTVGLVDQHACFDREGNLVAARRCNLSVDRRQSGLE